ncbi:MAG: phosphoribosyltransferase family protein [Bdellovibrionota bacterium]
MENPNLNPVFKNRDEAARALAHKLDELALSEPVVWGIPRGAVVMAKMIARRLRGDFDVVLVRKVPHAEHREFAVGSVTETGEILLGTGGKQLGLQIEDLEDEANWQHDEILRRRKLYTPHRDPVDVHGRVVVIVDDGIATGSTMEAAVVSARSQGATRIIAASPVASENAVDFLNGIGAEVAVVMVPKFFFSVSQFYEEFDQVADDEVIEALGDEFESILTSSLRL